MLSKRSYIGIILLGFAVGIIDLIMTFLNIVNGRFIVASTNIFSFLLLAWSTNRMIKLYDEFYGKKEAVTLEDVRLMEYQINYPTLNLRLKKENELVFDLGLIYCYTKEAEKGFKVKKITKTSRKGTKFTYISIKKAEEMQQYIKDLNSMIDEFNKKHEQKIGMIQTN